MTTCRKCKSSISRENISVMTIGKTTLCDKCFREWCFVRDETWSRWFSAVEKREKRGMNAQQLADLGLLDRDSQEDYDRRRS